MRDMKAHLQIQFSSKKLTQTDFRFSRHAWSVAFAGFSVRYYASLQNGWSDAELEKAMDEPDLEGIT